MKYLMILILIVAVGLVYSALKQPIAEIYDCYSDIEMDHSTVGGSDWEAIEGDSLEKCQENQKRIPQISACTTEVLIEHQYASELLRIAALVKPKLRAEYAIETHNRSCMQYPDTLLE